jgi:hypothetical protein
MTSRGQYKALLHEHAGVPEARVRSEWREAIESVFSMLRGPKIEPHPKMTLTLWRSMRCRLGDQSCDCEMCLVDQRNRGVLAQWEASMATRPSLRKPFPFGSDGDVADKLIAHAQDGSTAPSYFGPMLDRSRDEATLGAKLARAHGTRSPAGIYHAELRADAWRCYVDGCSRAEVRQDANTAHAIRVTLMAQSGLDVGEDAALAKRARWAVRVELAARELIPAPSERATRMLRAIESRRAELLTRR